MGFITFIRLVWVSSNHGQVFPISKFYFFIYACSYKSYRRWICLNWLPCLSTSRKYLTLMFSGKWNVINLACKLLIYERCLSFTLFEFIILRILEEINVEKSPCTICWQLMSSTSPRKGLLIRYKKKASSFDKGNTISKVLSTVLCWTTPISFQIQKLEFPSCWYFCCIKLLN